MLDELRGCSRGSDSGSRKAWSCWYGLIGTGEHDCVGGSLASSGQRDLVKCGHVDSGGCDLVGSRGYGLVGTGVVLLVEEDVVLLALEGVVLLAQEGVRREWSCWLRRV